MFSYLNINTKKQQKQSIAEKMEAFSGGGTEGEMALSPGSDWTCPQGGSCGQMGLQLLGWSHHQMAPSPPSPEPLAPLCSLLGQVGKTVRLQTSIETSTAAQTKHFWA